MRPMAWLAWVGVVLVICEAEDFYINVPCKVVDDHGVLSSYCLSPPDGRHNSTCLFTCKYTIDSCNGITLQTPTECKRRCLCAVGFRGPRCQEIDNDENGCNPRYATGCVTTTSYSF